jgi:hypothetical protein
MQRVFDLFFGVILLLSLVIVMLFIAIVIRLSSKGPSLYWSDRVGKNNEIFKMPKFRSMMIDTPAVATHLLDNPDVYLSPIGGFLRRFSLDELPQLLSVLKGDTEHGLITIHYNDLLKIARFKARMGRINERLGSALVQRVRRLGKLIRYQRRSVAQIHRTTREIKNDKTNPFIFKL